MVNFDVESLFTNIPLQETKESCAENLFDSNEYFGDISKNSFCEQLTLTMNESFILLNNEYYPQSDRVAMSTPMGPMFANTFLSLYEVVWLNNCPLEFKPKTYMRYIDDTFLLLENVQQVEDFKQYLNSQHMNIKFHSEIEIDNSLSFLHIKIVRIDRRFFKSVYWKPTFSRVFTDYESFIPKSFKFALTSPYYIQLLNYAQICAFSPRIK